MSKFRLGRHISTSQSFINTPWYAHQLGCEVFQIFLGSPQQVISKARQKEELIKFGQGLIKYDIQMVVHGSYTINFCHPVKSKKFQLSVKSLVQDLRGATEIGENCLGVIIHMGKNIPENKITYEEAIDNYVMGLQNTIALIPDGSNIILETGASQGSEIASDIDGLAEIYWKLEEHERTRVYFCIDTCHIWATGYDISSAIGVKKFFQEFEDKIGIEKIICMHFNDSRTPLESCVDRHADLDYGFIKSGGLKAVARFAKKNKIPLIMETPLDAVNKETNQDVTFDEELSMVKSWVK